MANKWIWGTRRRIEEHQQQKQQQEQQQPQPTVKSKPKKRSTSKVKHTRKTKEEFLYETRQKIKANEQDQKLRKAQQRQQVRQRPSNDIPEMLPDRWERNSHARERIERLKQQFQELPYKHSAREEYQRTGEVPKDIKQQITPPKEVLQVGLGPEYQKSVYEEYIGHKTKRPEGFVGPIAPSGMKSFERLYRKRTSGNISWVIKHGTFKTETGKTKTWGQLKKEEPALYLKKQKGVYQPTFDIRKWSKEHYEKLGYSAGVKQVSYATLQAFDIDMWTKLITKGKGKAQEYALTKDYMMTKKVRSGKPVEAWLEIQTPAYTNVIIPFSIGAGLGYLFRGAGALSTRLSGTATGKLLGHVSTKLPKVIGAAAVGFASYDIGRSIHSKGIGDEETVSKILTYGSQFGFAYAGARSTVKTSGVKRPFVKKELTVFQDKFGTVREVTGQRYIELFGKQFRFGKTLHAIPKAGTQSFGSTISSSQIVPYRPSGLAKYNAPVFGLHPPVGKTTISTSRWGNKLFAETGQGWRSGIDKRGFSLSTKVWPKPKLYRSYETYYRFIVISKSPVGITSKPVWLKQGKSFKGTDIFKTDQQISKELGFGSTQKSGTVTLQKTKTVSKQKQVLQQQTKQEQLVVPESLLKPVYKREMLQLSKQSQAYKMLQGLKTRSAVKPRSLQGVIFGFDFAKSFGLKKDYRLSRKTVSFAGTVPAFGLDRKKAYTSISALGKVVSYSFKTPKFNVSVKGIGKTPKIVDEIVKPKSKPKAVTTSISKVVYKSKDKKKLWYDISSYGKKYKFRKADIPNPFKNMFDKKIKPVSVKPVNFKKVKKNDYVKW